LIFGNMHQNASAEHLVELAVAKGQSAGVGDEGARRTLRICSDRSQQMICHLRAPNHSIRAASHRASEIQP
jgi:hypothetical protein